ncbi:MAG: hypothetical protein UCO70_07710 [Collinsella stercoris]|nr:hypothetical protein [Collinsella stercoris]
MLDNLSLMGPDEEELSLSAVVSSATLLPACVYSAYSIIVNIMPVMGKRAALFYLTRGSIETVWIPIAIFIFSLMARKVDDWRLFALTAIFGLVACIIAFLRFDLYQTAVYLAVVLCCSLSAIKSREY